MILKLTQQDADASHSNEYFDAMRQRNYEASFEGVKNFITQNTVKLRHRQRKPVRKWQWMLAVLLPLLVVLACTKTERTEPVGQALSFSIPAGDDAAKQQVEKLVGGMQTVVSPDKQKPGHLSYTCFLPAQGSHNADAVIGQLKMVKGVAGFTTTPLNAQVKESLLSQLGHKIFSTHVDATEMSDAEMQNTLMKQLKAQGFHDISVTVTRNENGIRTLELHPAEDANNYTIDMTVDDKGTRMVLQEERITSNNRSAGEKPQVNFGSMTDAQVRDYVRTEHGKGLRDEDITITRTPGEIGITIKQSDQKEAIMRFKLH